MTHKASFILDPAFKTQVFPSIRSKTLMKLLLLTFVFINQDSEMAQKILARQRRETGQKHLWARYAINFAWSLRPQDVMPVIHCSQRTAIDYIEALRLLTDWFDEGGSILRKRWLSYLYQRKRTKKPR
jgi:hypothetical protein